MSNQADERIDYAAEIAALKAEMAALKTEHSSALARTAVLEGENALLYATEAIEGLEKRGKLIKDKPAEIKKLVGMKTMDDRREYLQHIQLNYADAERSPARGQSWLPIDDGHVEGAEAKDQPIAEPSAVEVLQYGEDHNIDISTDAGLRQATRGLVESKKKSA